MKIIVLDTETLGLQNPTIYELGFIIYDTETNTIIKERDYLIKQVYDNLDLFNTAYYSSKRPIYEEMLVSKLIKRVYWGYALNMLLKDIEKYNVSEIYAYNSRFDKNAINHTIQALNGAKGFESDILDIMNYIQPIVSTQDYQDFCESNGYMTKHKTPRPQKKAETLYRYLTNNTDFIEDHMALLDSQIELTILMTALAMLG
jgi:hypothetical protein